MQFAWIIHVDMHVDIRAKALHNAQSLMNSVIVLCKNAECHTHLHKILHSVHAQRATHTFAFKLLCSEQARSATHAFA